MIANTTQQEVRIHRNTKTGIVVSDKMDKTVVVRVDRRIFHERYKKLIKRTSKFRAHDPENQCRIGDKVLIIETRPLSRLKRWAVKSILEKAK
jgi:small subunit ribosomal protein S17